MNEWIVITMIASFGLPEGGRACRWVPCYNLRAHDPAPEAAVLYNGCMNVAPITACPSSHAIRSGTVLALLFALIAAPLAAVAQDISGLRLGMARAEVEKLTGKLAADRQSALKNAFIARKLPGEGKNPLFAFDERNVYFDDAGRLWRIRLRIHAANGKAFSPPQALAFYRALGDRMAAAHRLHRVEEMPPVWMPAANCDEARSLAAQHGPNSAVPAPAEAPPVGEANIVVMQIGCGSVRRWSRTFIAKGAIAHEIALADGSPYASPVIYQIYRTVGDDPDDPLLFEQMQRRAPAR